MADPWTAQRTQAIVTGFGEAERIALADSPVPRPRKRDVLVRVTHASVGSTDVLARRGGYLLQPMVGFTPGYDFVGVLETVTGSAELLGLRVGSRVVGCLPRMGSHTTHLVLDPSFLIRVPDALDSAVAATSPLDLVTAALALRMAMIPAGGSVLIQGVTGAVGAFAAQHGVQAGLSVFGTASVRSRPEAERLGATFVDYADPAWPIRVRDASGGGVDGAIDHTGSPLVRKAVSPHGTLVHTAFVGTPGRERRDTATGGITSGVRRWSRPRERVCSVPLFVETQRKAYREMLTGELELLASGVLTAPKVVAVPFGEVWDAQRLAEHPEPRTKVVLEMPSAD
ncbi:alcohol dehydrogenase catalytic domain-containing protein [Leifsonia poae]|uniref:alcohol dehydrogenase catalytic domain-containing protein n=1 Tax=Leifsonia poae TaxID=110933 RepID=UPI003D66661C